LLSRHVRGWICLERVVASLRAEIVRLPSVLDSPCGFFAVDAHATHRIHFHRHLFPLRSLGADKASRILEMRVYSAGVEGGVVIHEADERRPPSVLPGESKEEQARSVSNAVEGRRRRVPPVVRISGSDRRDVVNMPRHHVGDRRPPDVNRWEASLPLLAGDLSLRGRSSRRQRTSSSATGAQGCLLKLGVTRPVLLFH
jgi:hypothetical protein